MSALPTSLPLQIAPDHPAFAGHFPGHPIVPGVVLLDEALLALAAAERLQPATLQVAVAKFLVPVRPGDSLNLSYRATAPGSYAIEIQLGGMDVDLARVAATANITIQGAAQEGEA